MADFTPTQGCYLAFINAYINMHGFPPQMIEGLPVEEFIARNADPIWLHQNELWELTPRD